MTVKQISSIFPAVALLILVSCNSGADKTPAAGTDTDSAATTNGAVVRELPHVKTEPVEYEDGIKTFNSIAAFDSANAGKKPIVLIIPEWWGVTDYVKDRAKQIAELGYFAMVVDMYGGGKVLSNPKDAGNEAMKYYKNPQLAQERFDNALAIARSYPQADTSRIAAIGYCFGGTMVLNMARLGERLKGVVSFHGGLENHGITARKGGIIPSVLVLNGDADSFVPVSTVNEFKKEMEAANASMQFIGYPNAKHAFTNPGATALGEKFKLDIKYDEAADKASWEEMKKFLEKIFQ
ncbi:dienelactone hydrolase family protein [Niabella beijingensis]|uniref:dienelactone hydrolase family protein n=1 Tax=Niabella beijingensis TaxID=2872700 RepID=UPI001CBABD26|nr:dienelactone hydrolase family protein [Niabella beijingensis]MBZ4187403.1 dienelactone hydrolase family protein [Niabella beijingensis]